MRFVLIIIAAAFLAAAAYAIVTGEIGAPF